MPMANSSHLLYGTDLLDKTILRLKPNYLTYFTRTHPETDSTLGELNYWGSGG